MPEFTFARLVVSLVMWTAGSLLVYWHADRHGSKRATAWGIAAFVAMLPVVPLYFARHWWRTRRRA